MTAGTMERTFSASALKAIKDEVSSQAPQQEMITSELLDAWASIPLEVRSALISSELSTSKPTSSLSRVSTATTAFSTTSGSSVNSSNSVVSSRNSSSSKDDDEDDPLGVFYEECPKTGAKVTMRPLERAPNNVFTFEKTRPVSTVTTTTRTKTVSTARGWRNVFNLPISYDVTMVPHGTILDPSNLQLLEATGVHAKGYNRRFAVIDAEVDAIYGDKIRAYFQEKGIDLATCVLNGGEAEKRTKAVDEILDQLCAYKLRRREPFLAIGGGVILDIAGMAACLYRRGVPFVRVPTTLLAIVDASVGVKNGVDYCCAITDEAYKNRVGSFYAPSSCLLDSSFIATQDARNIANGMGEILKLGLVRSSDLFDLLESHGKALIESRFDPNPSTPAGVSDRIIDLSIQIMLEELGPNLWETKLDRCVDYGHTFSKLLEMVPGADIMHGEAVNVDGFFCVVLSHLRGYITMDTVNRIFACMKTLSLPTNSEDLKSELAWQSCKDAVEHRHGAQRIPLITEIGESVCVSDITPDELDRALEVMATFPH
eukprot:CAMPEP_0195522326 /NCGR_PEP_ID=MMETSP0794_2-20130614/20388_1 /TAXON_ID=515487 /ORGANISM="Stephanopyxis turris, Strain CCMP 815" /LENGTH=541 /DNA_ID=CAMNT_0040652055 /DNA_START=86 /DNA_END=1711 /DNA_ORIENTATION=-